MDMGALSVLPMVDAAHRELLLYRDKYGIIR